MSKRSNFPRNKRDLYPTPIEGAQALLKHLPRKTKYVEPCAADGQLVSHLKSGGHDCTFASDIVPLKRGYKKLNALDLTRSHCKGAKFIITNPPWGRKAEHDFILHKMIEHFMKLKPTWLLIDADWAHTKQAAPFMKHCVKMVAIGRLKWIPGSKHTGKDNCCWYLFDKNHTGGPKFVPRS